MTQTKFSVAMCVYGKDNVAHFKRAVESVLNQTLVPDEVVLVVDGPVLPELGSVIDSFGQNSMFRIIRLTENMGHGIARRVSLDNCAHDIVALMDADDICLPDRFEKQIKIIEKGEADIVGGDISEFVGEEDNIVAYRRVFEKDKDIKRDMKKRCPMNQVTVAFKKEIYEKSGGYIDWYCEEDYYLWLRMMQNNATFANTGTTLVNVRVGKEMYNRRGGWKYFKSEATLQKYMLDNKIINVRDYIFNCTKRFAVQVIIPNKLRGWVFKKFARKSVKTDGIQKV